LLVSATILVNILSVGHRRPIRLSKVIFLVIDAPYGPTYINWEKFRKNEIIISYYEIQGMSVANFKP